MLELTGFGSVLRGIGMLYWLLAISAIALALYKNKTARTRAIWVTVALLVFGFLPAKQMVEQYQKNEFAKEAWAYFKHKCDTEAGEKIYKTFTGVKSVLVVKPLPPATEKDLYDQFWMGDPYSFDLPGKNRGERVARALIGRVEFINKDYAQNGFHFIEQIVMDGNGKGFERIFPLSEYPFIKRSVHDKSESRFGVSWEDISKPEDRKYWVAGSRLSVIDLSDNSVVAERIGYFIEAGFGSAAGQRRPWQTSRGAGTTCPAITNRDFTDRWFVLKAINPTAERENGK